MANYKFFQDQFLEETGGKYSSKKVWGAIVMVLLCASYVMDGFHFYKINENLFNTMAIVGTTLLGLRILNNIIKKKES